AEDRHRPEGNSYGDLADPSVGQSQRRRHVEIGDRDAEETEPEEREADHGYEGQADEGSEEEEGYGHREVRSQIQHAPEQDAPSPRERIEMSHLQIVPASIVPGVVRHVRPEMDEHEAGQGGAEQPEVDPVSRLRGAQGAAERR